MIRTSLVLVLCSACEPMTQPAARAPERVVGPPGGADPADPADPVRQPAVAAPRSPALPADAEALVELHNRVRAQHCAAPLRWSGALADVAQRWADSLRARGCKFDHSHGRYGENLAAGTIGYMNPPEVVAMWADEVKQYSFTQPGFSMETGHFTQVVWRGTTQLGCGHAQCNGNDLWVCEYDPPGNWEGQYQDNVLPAGCR